MTIVPNSTSYVIRDERGENRRADPHLDSSVRLGRTYLSVGFPSFYYKYFFILRLALD